MWVSHTPREALVGCAEGGLEFASVNPPLGPRDPVQDRIRPFAYLSRVDECKLDPVRTDTSPVKNLSLRVSRQAVGNTVVTAIRGAAIKRAWGPVLEHLLESREAAELLPAPSEAAACRIARIEAAPGPAYHQLCIQAEDDPVVPWVLVHQLRQHRPVAAGDRERDRVQGAVEAMIVIMLEWNSSSLQRGDWLKTMLNNGWKVFRSRKVHQRRNAPLFQKLIKSVRHATHASHTSPGETISALRLSGKVSKHDFFAGLRDDT